MHRVPLVLGLGLIVAQGFCGIENCPAGGGCATHETVQSDDSLQPGRTLGLTDGSCSTCVHPHVEVTWSLQPQTTISGNLHLTVRGSCFAVPGCCVPDQADFSATLKSYNFGVTNLKSPCGDGASDPENVQEAFNVVLQNNATDEILSPVIKLVCGTLESTTKTPLRPSGVRRQP